MTVQRKKCHKMKLKCLFGFHEWETTHECTETGTYSISGTGGKNSLKVITKVDKKHQECLHCDRTRVLEDPKNEKQS